MIECLWTHSLIGILDRSQVLMRIRRTSATVCGFDRSEWLESTTSSESRTDRGVVT
jgi:hypothetical protein